MTQDTKQIDAAIEDFIDTTSVRRLPLSAATHEAIIEALQQSKQISEIDWEGMEKEVNDDLRAYNPFRAMQHQEWNGCINEIRKAVMGDE